MTKDEMDKDYAERREKAAKELDIILTKYNLGLKPVISMRESDGAILPGVRLIDLKTYEEAKPADVPQAPAKPAKKQK